MASINQLIEGLQILAKYYDADDICASAAEHDTLYINGEEAVVTDELTDPKMTPEDHVRLYELGWHIDSQAKCWAVFV